MKNKFLTLLLASTFLVTACGGGDGGNNSTSESSSTSSSDNKNTGNSSSQSSSTSSSDTKSNASRPATASDLVGTWDDSYVEDDKKDISYTIIKSNLSFKSYDYLGDEVDNGKNCYELISGSIEDMGNGNFKRNDGSILKINIQGDALTVEDTENGKVIRNTVYKSNKTEADFKPVCS